MTKQTIDNAIGKTARNLKSAVVSLIGPVLSYITITVTGNQGSLAVSPTSGNQAQCL